MNYTNEEKEKGFSICKECGKGVRVLQAGFDVKTHICAMCKDEVADIDDFMNVDVDMMSK